jgi:hypothetical protein
VLIADPSSQPLLANDGRDEVTRRSAIIMLQCSTKWIVICEAILYSAARLLEPPIGTGC